MDKTAYYVEEIEKLAEMSVADIKKRLKDIGLSDGAYESTKERNDFYKDEFDFEPIPKDMEIVGEDGYGDVYLYNKADKKIYFHDHEDPEEVHYNDSVTHRLGLNSDYPGGFPISPLQQKLLDKGITHEDQLSHQEKLDLTGLSDKASSSGRGEKITTGIAGGILGSVFGAAPFIKEKNPWIPNRPKAKFIAAGLGALLGGLGGYMIPSGQAGAINHEADRKVSDSLSDLHHYGFYDKVADYTEGILKMAIDSKTLKARQFAQEVQTLSKKYNLPFFFVTDGASATKNNGNEAIRLARANHEVWEKQNGISPKHDWSKNIKI